MGGWVFQLMVPWIIGCHESLELGELGSGESLSQSECGSCLAEGRLHYNCMPGLYNVQSRRLHCLLIVEESAVLISYVFYA